MITAADFKATVGQLATALTKWAPDFRDDATMRVWWKLVIDLDPDRLAEACDTAARTLKAFPAPVELMEIYHGNPLDDDAVGQDVSEKIEAAIPLFGYTNPDGAREYIGDVGWAIVQDHGGWSVLCETTYDDLITLRKLWRDAARNRFKKMRAFGVDEPIGVPPKAQEWFAVRYLAAAAAEKPDLPQPLRIAPAPMPVPEKKSRRSLMDRFHEEMGA